MRKFRYRSVLVSFMLIAAAMVPIGAAAEVSAPEVSREAAVPGIAPSKEVADSAIYLDENLKQIPGPSEGQRSPSEDPALQAAMAGCTPGSGRDNPHYSSGDVSGHGWWTKGNCTGSKAKVYSCLYEFYTDGSWRRKSCSPTLSLKPYTGSGQRTVARKACNSQALISWRNHVDVDVEGQVDTADNPHNEALVRCMVR